MSKSLMWLVENIKKKHKEILEVINIACLSFPGGLVVKNLPSKAEDVDLIPD